MRKICFVNGSLRGAKSSSLKFLNDVMARMNAAGFNMELVTVKAKIKSGYPDETLKVVADAGAVVMAFPLFTYSLPGGLTRFLEDYYAYARKGGSDNKNVKVFVIVNCGFPEPEVAEEAIRVIRNFCARLRLSYRFTVVIGTGPVTAMTKNVPLLNLSLKRAFAKIIRDIESEGTGELQDVFVKPIIPKAILLKIKEQYEKKSVTLA